jgi:hypothetical protein
LPVNAKPREDIGYIAAFIDHLSMPSSIDCLRLHVAGHSGSGM